VSDEPGDEIFGEKSTLESLKSWRAGSLAETLPLVPDDGRQTVDLIDPPRAAAARMGLASSFEARSEPDLDVVTSVTHCFPAEA
jgi:hypothetical protein